MVASAIVSYLFVEEFRGVSDLNAVRVMTVGGCATSISWIVAAKEAERRDSVADPEAVMFNGEQTDEWKGAND
jgi:hypothetical protein